MLIFLRIVHIFEALANQIVYTGRIDEYFTFSGRTFGFSKFIF